MFNISIIFALIRKYKEFSITKMKVIYGLIILINLFLLYLYFLGNGPLINFVNHLKDKSWMILNIGLILMFFSYITVSFLSLKVYFKTFSYNILKRYQEDIEFETHPWLVSYTLIVLLTIWISVFIWVFWILLKILLINLNISFLLTTIYLIFFLFSILIIFVILLINEYMVLISNNYFDEDIKK